jgi:hypothetical protein
MRSSCSARAGYRAITDAGHEVVQPDVLALRHPFAEANQWAIQPLGSGDIGDARDASDFSP